MVDQLANADELTHVGMEIVSEGTKLSGMVLLKILESITKLFEREKDNRDFIINDNTKEGKQKIKDLIKKHSEGVMSFDDNLTKEQLNDYQKEFKKLGVDFSVIKNEKDNYSLFFSSKDANVIEKALKNIIEKKSRILEEKRDKTAENNLGKEKQIHPQNRKEKQVEQNKNKSAKPQEYSMNAVKKLDEKLKSQDNKNQDRKRTTELSR